MVYCQGNIIFLLLQDKDNIMLSIKTFILFHHSLLKTQKIPLNKQAGENSIHISTDPPLFKE